MIKSVVGAERSTTCVVIVFIVTVQKCNKTVITVPVFCVSLCSCQHLVEWWLKFLEIRRLADRLWADPWPALETFSHAVRVTMAINHPSNELLKPSWGLPASLCSGSLCSSRPNHQKSSKQRNMFRKSCVSTLQPSLAYLPMLSVTCTAIAV